MSEQIPQCEHDFGTLTAVLTNSGKSIAHY